MKNKLTAILALFLCTTFANAQDLIQLKSGKTEEVQILEINKEKIKFKKFKNLNGPTYSVRLEKVASIKLLPPFLNRHRHRSPKLRLRNLMPRNLPSP